MPKKKVWLVSSSVVIYHLDKDCGALKNAKHALESRDIDLDITDLSRDSTMRLCGHCQESENDNALTSLAKDFPFG